MIINNTFRALIKIAGKILFVIGLVLNICMIFFGFWPSFIYVLIMLAGTGMISLNTNIDITKLFHREGKERNKIIHSITSSVKKLDSKSLQTFLITVIGTILGILILAVSVLYFGQNYFKKRDTISDCKQITAALELYKESKKEYPLNLEMLISGNPMRSNWTKDSWGNFYKYNTDNNKNTFTLISAGKDCKFNTSDDISF